jgi:hypothetical protein
VLNILRTAIMCASRPILDPTNPNVFANSLAYNYGGETDTVPMTTIDAICAYEAPAPY